MPVNMSIPDGTTTHLNHQALAEYQKAVARYSEDLLSEAGRLEATSHTSAGNPEITSSMVRDADLLMRRGYLRPRKSRLLILAQVVSTVFGFLTGLLADSQQLQSVGSLFRFVLVLTVTITTTVIVVLKD